MRTAKELCHELMLSDSEDEVIRILEEEGYWQDPACWRYLGDDDSNYAIAGNQQSRPEAALVEKIINAVDARLINECLLAGIDPESSAAPKTIREAVARFIERALRPDSPNNGRVKYWGDSERTAQARQITLAATGKVPSEGNPTFSIADAGEGQSPKDFPATFMSLQRGNKMKIQFVQGKWNMGGTGALRFCGRHSIQLLISRRNPTLVDSGSQDDSGDWGFTVVRREPATGLRRASVYTYLAPLGAKERTRLGDVLHFRAATWPIFPDERSAHAREAEHGTLIKLYEYDSPGFRSNIIRTDPGLLRRLDFLLPEVALPVRLFECRPQYRGHAGSFETNVSGLGVRLEDDRAENLEPGFPTSAKIAVRDQQMDVTIYAFKKGVADRYRMQEGIAFIVNGQTHGAIPAVFFSRKRIGLSYLADSLLVTVDCSNMAVDSREDLFMNSRDRLQEGDLKHEIAEELEELLRGHTGLRQLKDRRRQEEIAEKLSDSKPLEQLLQDILRKSPALSALFLAGTKLPNPFKLKNVTTGEPEKYSGKPFPTYFRFKGMRDAERLERDCHLNQRARIHFETDAANDYFSRDIDQGQFILTIQVDDKWEPVSSYTLNLNDGTATLNLSLPDGVSVGSRLNYRASAIDPTMIEPFVNEFSLSIKPEAKQQPTGGGGSTRKSKSKNKGNETKSETYLALPNITEVTEELWEKYKFDKYTALHVKHAGTENGNGAAEHKAEAYDFFVNVDNHYLRGEQKVSATKADILKARFIYAQVLVGLALLQGERELTAKAREVGGRESSEDRSIEDVVDDITRALSPVLLPMIDSLGGLDTDAG